MSFVAVFLTEQPAPNCEYKTFQVAMKKVHIRLMDMTNKGVNNVVEAADVAEGMALDGETMLNTFEID